MSGVQGRIKTVPGFFDRTRHLRDIAFGRLRYIVASLGQKADRVVDVIACCVYCGEVDPSVFVKRAGKSFIVRIHRLDPIQCHDAGSRSVVHRGDQ